VGTIAALRQVVTGALAEKLMMRASAAQVPELEKDIAALDGAQFGKNSVGAQARKKPAA
jgi:hypothetical protein